jgi:actin
VVIDNGSGMCKAGLSGDDAPRTSFPCMVGRSRYNTPAIIGINQQDRVDFEAEASMAALNLRYPIEHGIVCNWEDMTKVWHYCFYN